MGTGQLATRRALHDLEPQLGPRARMMTHDAHHVVRKKPAFAGLSRGVSDGTRTRDHLDHNQELYQLSYAHHDEPIGPAPI
jgi:hypothetical protein